MKRNTIVEIIAALFILLFVYTAVSKLMEGVKFEVVLGKSPLIADYAAFISWALPVTELLVALLLLFPRTRLLGLYSSATLMTIFTAYLAYMIAFTPKLPCSCGGVLRHMNWNQHLLFNVFFLLLALWGILLSKKSRKSTLAEATSARLQTKYSI